MLHYKQTNNPDHKLARSFARLQFYVLHVRRASWFHFFLFHLAHGSPDAPSASASIPNIPIIRSAINHWNGNCGVGHPVTRGPMTLLRLSRVYDGPGIGMSFRRNRETRYGGDKSDHILAHCPANGTTMNYGTFDDEMSVLDKMGTGKWVFKFLGKHLRSR